MLLDGMVVVVTGACGHLGRAMVSEAKARAARVALVDLSEGLAPQGGGAWAADLTSLSDAVRVFGDVAEHFGHIDALVNIAGGFRWETLTQSAELDEWDTLHALNLRTCVNACKAALPYLQKQGLGRIVNVGAIGAIKGANGMGAYAASKSGVMRLTEALADEVKLQGITVNAVLPSIIDTPQNRTDMPEADFSRWVKPAEIASAIALLLSADASAITGALVPVTGRT